MSLSGAKEWVGYGLRMQGIRCLKKQENGSIHYSGILAADKEVPTCLSMPSFRIYI